MSTRPKAVYDKKQKGKPVTTSTPAALTDTSKKGKRKSEETLIDTKQKRPRRMSSNKGDKDKGPASWESALSELSEMIQDDADFGDFVDDDDDDDNSAAQEESDLRRADDASPDEESEGETSDEGLSSHFGRAIQNLMHPMDPRLKSIAAELEAPGSCAAKTSTLQELSEILSMSSEDALGGRFDVPRYAKILTTLAAGDPGAEGTRTDSAESATSAPALDDLSGPLSPAQYEALGLDPASAAAAAAADGYMSDGFNGGFPDELRVQLMILASRCMANLMEALPGAAHALVDAGAVPVLCARLRDIEFIDLAEQTFLTLHKLSREAPGAIVSAGGLTDLLAHLDFFSLHDQRTAVTTVANCCSRLGVSRFSDIRGVVPRIAEILGYADARVVEQATLALVHIVESYRLHGELLEVLLTTPVLAAATALLNPDSTILSGPVYARLLSALVMTVRASPQIAVGLLKAGVADVLYHILTGVSSPTQDTPNEKDLTENAISEPVTEVQLHDPTDTGRVEKDTDNLAVIQNLVQTPKEQIIQTLTLVSELLPPIPKDEATSETAHGTKPVDGASNDVSSEQDESTPLTHFDLLQQALQESPHIERFFDLLLPVLVQVYLASVQSNVRHKALTGMVKIVMFCPTASLRRCLGPVPMASFLLATLTSSGLTVVTLQALHLIKLLLRKLPELYTPLFYREGVFYELDRLAQRSLPRSSPSPAPAGEPTETSPAADSDIRPMASLAPRFVSLEGSPGSFGGSPGSFDASSALAAFLSRPPRYAATRSTSPADIEARTVLSARKLRNAYVHFDSDAAAAVSRDILASLKAVSADLSTCAQSGGDATPALERLRTLVLGADAATSFELIASGLSEGLLQFLMTNSDGSGGLEGRAARRLQAMTVLGADGSRALVRRFQDSLSRDEDFEVATALPRAENGPGSSSPIHALIKPIRLRLEFVSDAASVTVPPSMASLSVSMHAVAGLNSLSEFLKTRLATHAQSLRFLSRSGSSSSRSPISALLGQLLPELGSEFDGATIPADPAAEDDEETSAIDIVSRNADTDESKAVVAQTPNGTRIGTPNAADATAASARRRTSGATTPSYAAALGAADADYHFEFYVDDRKVDKNNTVFGTFYKNLQRQALAKASNTDATAVPAALSSHDLRALWRDFHVIKYRRVPGAEPAESTDDEDKQLEAAADTKANGESESGDVVQHEPLAPPEDGATNAPTAITSTGRSLDHVLQLLCVFHELNLDPASNEESLIPARLFINPKLTAKMNRQLEEPAIIAGDCLPPWSLDLMARYAFLFPFETRLLYLQSTAFGRDRVLNHWAKLHQQQQQQGQATSFTDDSLAAISRLTRQKFRLSRSRVFESALKIFGTYGPASTLLEIEFFDEVGSGLGPTLEFYALTFQAFNLKEYGLWRDSSVNETDSNAVCSVEASTEPAADPATETATEPDGISPSNYVYSPTGLFPAPRDPSSHNSADEIANSHFRSLGIIVAKALKDSRTVDLHLNPAFVRLILAQPLPLTLASLRLVDPQLALSLERIVALPSDDVAGLGLDFTLPGYSSIELIGGGRDRAVDASNVDEFVQLVISWTLQTGVSRQVEAFREGFSSVFPISMLEAFTVPEVVMLLGGDGESEDWSLKTLLATTKADHGFTLDSRAVRDLLEVMTTLSSDERRAFLSFMTGSPRLPIGGFAALTPALTIVRKDGGDRALPSVMTCVNYIKLPNYSTKAILREKLFVAILDGAGGFHLS